MRGIITPLLIIYLGIDFLLDFILLLGNYSDPSLGSFELGPKYPLNR